MATNEQLPAKNEGDTPTPLPNLAVLLEDATTCPDVTTTEWTYITGVPAAAPQRLATVLLVHCTPGIDIATFSGEYVSLLHRQEITASEPYARNRRQRLGEIAVRLEAHGPLTKIFTAYYNAVGGYEQRLMKHLTREQGPMGAASASSKLQAIHERTAFLRYLCDKTDSPDHPVLSLLERLRDSTQKPSQRAIYIDTDRVIRFIMLDNQPPQSQ
jgi:hypothetical protein